MDQTGPPLDVHRLYFDRDLKHRRVVAGKGKAAAGPRDLLAAAPALPASVYGSLLVRASLCRQVAQQALATTAC